MNLYIISQSVNNDYDTYDGAIVAAENEEEARNIHPSGKWWSNTERWDLRDWCSKEHVAVEYIGSAEQGAESGVILSSFNAG